MKIRATNVGACAASLLGAVPAHAKVKTMKVSSVLDGVFTKVCTCKGFPLYGNIVWLDKYNICNAILD